MSPKQFFEMRLKHFFLKIQEYNRNKENEVRIKFEHERIQTTVLRNIHFPENKQVQPNQLYKLPWDVENEVEKQLNEMSKTEFDEYYKNSFKLQATSKK